MKIKKVEIQAFRAYSKVKDCTFDFSLDGNRTADFISIYAPNGFGKTSFYDAVEWCYTNNIYRFVRRDTLNKAYAQDEKQLKFEMDESKSPLLFIRNKNSPESLPGFVKVHLANSEVVKERKVPIPARIDSNDYGFDEKVTENHYFRDVILSQESIDAFLKEDQPDARYTKFMTLFGDKQLDNAYSNILYLIKVNTESLNKLEDELSELQLELPLDTDNSILDKVNSVLDDLQKLEIRVEKLTADSSDSELLTFTDKLADKVIDTEAQVKATNATIERTKSLELKLNEYTASQKLSVQLSTEIENLNKYKSTFKAIEANLNLIANNHSRIQAQLSVQKEIQALVAILPEYFEHIQLIQDSEALQSTARSELLEAQQKLAEQRSQEDALRARKTESQKLQSDLKRRQTSYPDFALTVSNSTTELEQLESKIQELQNQSNILAQESNLQEASIRLLENEIASIKKYEFSDLTMNDPELALKVELIRKQRNEVAQVRKMLDNIEAENGIQSKLQNDIKRIIVLGSEIVNRQKSEQCPLCSSSFADHEALSQSILNNPILSERLQSLLAAKSVTEKKLQNALDSIGTLRTEIIAVIEAKLTSARDRFQVLLRNNAQVQIQLELENKNLNIKRVTHNAILTQLNGKTLAQYEAQIRNDMDNVSKQITAIETEENSIAMDLIKSDQAVSEATNKMALAKSQILKSKSAIPYLRVGQYMKSQNLVSISVSYLKSVEEISKKDVDQLQANLSKAQAELDDNTKLVEAQNQNSVESELASFQAQLKELEGDQRTYAAQINELFPDRTFELQSDAIAANLKDRRASESALSKNLERIISLLRRAEEYKKNVLPFLTYNRNKVKRDNLSSEINFYRNVVGRELLNEKEKLAAYIDAQIQSFFYEDLINKLYQKIDPHPEYRQIKFKCDFTGEKPKMNVFVNDDGKTYVIPNLYFSTAQMNILSLSIFLAKALNATDDSGNPIDCIFIDDPIQSMDSINILSTIDLFRSIVVNLKKQIILSTHDENFHVLLQKKIPSAIYQAKYLELETFGIVKR